MSTFERIASVFGLGLGRRHFHERLLRYFAGDLDPVELRAFEVEILSSRYRRRVFASEYDRRTRTLGLAALASPDPEISECFSVPTLEAYARGRRSRDDRVLVEAHLSCPVCSLQVEGMQRELDPAAVTTWRDRGDELLGRLMGLAIRPGPLVAATAGVLLLVAVERVRPPESTAASPATASEYRSVGDGLAALELRAVDGDLRERSLGAEALEAEVTMSADSRLRVVGENADLEYPRYVALLSLDEHGDIRWHIPSWDGEIPPSMVEVPAGDLSFDRIEPVPSLPPGRHQLVLLLSHTPTNLERIRAELTEDIASDAVEASFVDVLGPRSSMTRWQVVVP